ncbi:MAG: hypothetical protein AB7G25_04755 [Sphingomonadaceae bacterium]
MTRRWAIGILGIAAAALLVGRDIIFPAKYRFRMTVEVETPEGIRRGSSVMEIRSSKEPFRIGNSHSLKNELIGEAVAVDMSRGTLFALITNTKSGQPLMDVVTYSLIERSKREISFWNAVKELGRSDHIGRQVELVPDQYPMFVRFRDIKDPKSVEQIKVEDIQTSFGSEIALRRITLQVTDGSVTNIIYRYLPWIDEFDDKMLDGSKINNSQNLSNTLSKVSFQQGFAR